MLGFELDRRQVFESAARLWVVNETVQPADAVAILGGGIETRPAAAADYLQRGLVHEILVSNVRSGVNRRSLSVHTAQNLLELKKLGVPGEAVVIFGCNLSSTFEELQALRAWSLNTGIRSLIVPTEYFSARRVRWVIELLFRNTGVKVQVPVLTSLDYLKGDWWNNPDAIRAFVREVVKYVGYRIVYGLFGSWSEPDSIPKECKDS